MSYILYLYDIIQAPKILYHTGLYSNIYYYRCDMTLHDYYPSGTILYDEPA